MNEINAYDRDCHVEEWEATLSDQYLEPAFRDCRPVVVETGEYEHDYMWEIDGARMRIGGSPSSRDGVVSTEYVKMAPWCGSHESGEFHSAADRLMVMGAEDTWLSVSYSTLFLQWPVAKDPALNQALTRAYNNWVADVSGQSPDRLKWVTVIDAYDPKEAAREMLRTKKMGSVGVMVLGEYGAKPLDHPDFTPIWETANDIGMPINVLPGTGALDAWADYPSVAADQFLMSVVRGFKTICTSGLLDRYPNVRDRIKLDALRSEHKAIVERGLPKMTPIEYIQAGRIYIGFEVDDDLLPYMVEKYSTDCWVYASDVPHAHRIPDSPRHVLDRTDLSDEVEQRILWEGVRRGFTDSIRRSPTAANKAE